MSSEMLTVLFAIIGVGVALGGFIQVSLRGLETRLEARINALEEAVADLRERMAKLEGFMEGLKAAITQSKLT